MGNIMPDAFSAFNSITLILGTAFIILGLYTFNLIPGISDFWPKAWAVIFVVIILAIIASSSGNFIMYSNNSLCKK